LKISETFETTQNLVLKETCFIASSAPAGLVCINKWKPSILFITALNGRLDSMIEQRYCREQPVVIHTSNALSVLDKDESINATLLVGANKRLVKIPSESFG
jgi:hypothetical protein